MEAFEDFPASAVVDAAASQLSSSLQHFLSRFIEPGTGTLTKPLVVVTSGE